MSDQIEIAAIILAAGASSRFGSDKLLHPVTFKGVTLPLAAHSIVPWLVSFEKVTVVVKPGSEKFCNKIRASLDLHDESTIHWVICDNAAQGMALSITCGVRSNLNAGGWLVGLADMPAVPAAAIKAVRSAILSGAVLSAPSYHGRRGHPVGFSSIYRDELLALSGDRGAKGILDRDKSDIKEISIDSFGILADIDIPGDLKSI